MLCRSGATISESSVELVLSEGVQVCICPLRFVDRDVPRLKDLHTGSSCSPLLCLPPPLSPQHTHLAGPAVRALSSRPFLANDEALAVGGGGACKTAC